MSIFFVLNVYDEPKAEVMTVCEKLLEIYPAAEIGIVFDGGLSASYANELNGLERTKFHTFAWRKTTTNKGRWTHDYLSMFLQSDKLSCVKVDPDTTVGRQLTYIPQGNCIYGHLTGKSFIHGGAIGFTRKAAQTLVDSQNLLDQSLPDFGGMNDPAVRICALRCQIPMVNHEDFCSPSKDCDPNKEYSFKHK